jgi:hypothetical protein
VGSHHLLGCHDPAASDFPSMAGMPLRLNHIRRLNLQSLDPPFMVGHLMASGLIYFRVLPNACEGPDKVRSSAVD